MTFGSCDFAVVQKPAIGYFAAQKSGTFNTFSLLFIHLTFSFDAKNLMVSHTTRRTIRTIPHEFTSYTGDRRLDHKVDDICKANYPDRFHVFVHHKNSM